MCCLVSRFHTFSSSSSGLNALKRASTLVSSTSSKLAGFHFGFCKKKPLINELIVRQNRGQKVERSSKAGAFTVSCSGRDAIEHLGRVCGRVLLHSLLFLVLKCLVECGFEKTL
ncbi:unnamed protein product, partial [Arabidopsis halleri]